MGLQTIQKPTRARALDTSGNNNHGQIYSGRALEFDGVSDYLNCGDTSDFVGLAEARTVSFWAYLLDGSASNDYYFSLGNMTIARGWFALRQNTDYLVFSDNQTDTNLNTTNADMLNSWNYLVVTYDGSTSVKVYVNGVIDTTITTAGTLATDQGGDTIIGARNSSGSGDGTTVGQNLNCNLANFQIWNAAWTQADVTYAYLNPEQLALNRGGTSLTESNLKVWYPMQDGHRGQQSFILDGSNTGLGSEELGSWTNNSSYLWTTLTTSGTSVTEADSDGSITMIATNPFTAVAGKTYKVSVNLTLNSGNLPEWWIAEGANGSVGDGVDFGTSTSGVNTGYWTAPSSKTMYLLVHIVNSVSNFSLSAVSVKPVNAKNHATTVFYGDMSELLSADQKTRFDDQLDNDDNLFDMGGTNVDSANTLLHANAFVSDGSATATFGGDGAGEARLTNTTSAKGLVTLAVTTVAGRTYRAGGKISTTGNSDIRFSVGSSTTFNTGSQSAALTPNDDTSGESADYVADDTTSFMQIQLESTTDTEYCEIDDFWVREVGTATGWTDADQQLDIPQTALQSYNQLAWFNGVGDTLTVSEFDFTTGQTLNMWLNPSDLSPYRSLFGIGASANYMRYCNGAETEKFEFEPNNDVVTTIDCGNAGVIQKDKWTMYTFIWNADRTMDIYFNGSLVGSGAATADTTDGKKLRISKFGVGYSTGNVTFQGAMTEISHYTDVLTQAEINDLYNDGKAKSALEASGSGGLSAYWRNNGLAQWDDLKGSNDGTVTASETLLIPAGVDGSRDNQGFLMNRQKDTNSLNLPSVIQDSTANSGSYVKLNGATTYDVDGGNVSFSFWIKWNADGNAQTILGYSGEAWYSFLGINAAGTQFYLEVDTDAHTAVSTFTALTEGDWYHFTLTTNGDGTINVYKNGVTTGVTLSYANFDNNVTFDQIGIARNDVYPCASQIDDILIYSDKLEAAEVLRNYNAGKRSHR
jgi:hypothetical protein